MLDAIRRRDIARGADGLAARFIARHQSMLDGGWNTARHLELHNMDDVTAAGEEMGVCHKLTLRQIEPALPPKEYGGSVNLLSFVSPTTKRFLENPELSILPDKRQKLPKLQGRIHVENGELGPITDALINCGVCSWSPFFNHARNQ